MTSRTRRTFTQDFKLEAAQLVVEQGYSIRQAAEAINVGKSTMDKWVRQLKNEHKGIVNHASPLTPDQRKIREFENGLSR